MSRTPCLRLKSLPLRSLVFAAVASGVWLTSHSASAQSVYPYPSSFPDYQLWPRAISVDGSVVVGRLAVHYQTGVGAAGRWSPTLGIVGGVLPLHLQAFNSVATGVSENGEVIAGNVRLGSGQDTNEIFVTSNIAFGLVNPFEGEPPLEAAPNGCLSADGQRLAGHARVFNPTTFQTTSWAFNMGPFTPFVPFMIRQSTTSRPEVAAMAAAGNDMAGTVSVFGEGGSQSAWHYGPLADDLFTSGIGAQGVAISADGSVMAADVGYLGESGLRKRVHIIGGPNAGELPNPFPGNIMECTAMSADAQTLCGIWYNSSNPGGPAFDGWIWKPGLGVVGARQHLGSLPGVDLSNFVRLWITAVSMDGMVLAGIGFQTDGHFRSVIIDLRKDTDGDGLYDHWETDGVPYISRLDGVQRLILPGANPLRKDIYVEIDAMQGLGPSEGALQRVRDAFSNAPVPAPDAPGGLSGIALHAEVDDQNIPVSDLLFDAVPYQTYKSFYFGTAAEREDLYDSEVILKTKKSIYRYAFFCRKIVGNYLGVAECPEELDAFGRRQGGDDLMIGLGTYTPPPGVTMEDIQAAAFMHELGHTLGLWHGGVNKKQTFNPNHYSVMNPLWAGVRRFGPRDRTPHLQLDYSRRALNVLNEDLLFEFEGIGGDPSVRVPIVVRAPITEGLCLEPPTNNGVCHRTNEQNILYTCINFVPMGGPVDWDNDRIISQDTPVCADPNGLESHSHHDVMESLNEWAMIVYSFKGSPMANGEFLQGISIDPCSTEAEETFLATLPAAPPDDPCTGLPPAVATPEPPTAFTCGSQVDPVKFTVDFVGAGPALAQWRWWNAALPVPAWVNFTEGVIPGGSVVVHGSTSRTLTLETPRIADFGTNSVLISCRITDACGLSADSPPSMLSLGEVAASFGSPESAGTCPYGSAEFAVSDTVLSGPISYQWVLLRGTTEILVDGRMPGGTVVTGANGPTLQFSSVAPSDFDDPWTAVACRLSNSCGEFDFGPFYFASSGVGIFRQPELVSAECNQPLPRLVMSAGAAVAAPATFQWTKNGLPMENGGRISGADTLTLTIEPPIGSDSADYACIVSGPCGSARTDTARFYYGPPRLAQDPPRFMPVCSRSNAFLSIEPFGSLFSQAQWMRNGVDIVDLPRHFGADTWTLFVTELEPADFSAQYSVRLQNDCGTFVSQPTSIRQFQPIEFAQQPQSSLVCPRGKATLTASPTIDQNLVLYWQVEDPANPGTWIPLFVGGPIFIGDWTCGAANITYDYALEVSLSGAPGCPTSLAFNSVLFSPCGGETQSDTAIVTLSLADFNCSGNVDPDDLSDFISAFFSSPLSPRADFDGNGVIDPDDLSSYIAAFFNP